MSIKKLSYPKPLPNRFSNQASDGSGGWMVIFIVALGFAAMLVLALGAGRP